MPFSEGYGSVRADREPRGSGGCGRPGVDLGRRRELLLRVFVAEGTRNPRLEEGAGRDPERCRQLVLPTQVGIEHLRIIGGDRAGDAVLHELGEGMLVQGWDGPGPQVRDRTDV